MYPTSGLRHRGHYTTPQDPQDDACDDDMRPSHTYKGGTTYANMHGKDSYGSSHNTATPAYSQQLPANGGPGIYNIFLPPMFPYPSSPDLTSKLDRICDEIRDLKQQVAEIYRQRGPDSQRHSSSASSFRRQPLHDHDGQMSRPQDDDTGDSFQPFQPQRHNDSVLRSQLSSLQSQLQQQQSRAEQAEKEREHQKQLADTAQMELQFIKQQQQREFQQAQLMLSNLDARLQ